MSARSRRAIRVFRYSFLNFPGYYVVTLFVGGMLKVFVPGIPNAVVYAAMAVTLLPHWRAFVFFGQVGAIVSPTRVFIRGLTPGFGLPRRRLVFLDLLPVSNIFLRVTRVDCLSDDGHARSRRLGHFSSDDFSFQSIRWMGNV